MPVTGVAGLYFITCTHRMRFFHMLYRTDQHCLVGKQAKLDVASRTARCLRRHGLGHGQVSRTQN